MAGAVAFDYMAWAQRYPELSNVQQPQASACFDEAGLYFPNTTQNPAFERGTLLTLLNMVTAHIVWLTANRDADGNPSSTGTQPAPAMVGRVSQASEGSVSVTTDYGMSGAGGPSEAWFLQTRYGSAFWQATAGFRTMRYFARPTRVPTAIFPGRLGPGRFS